MKQRADVAVAGRLAAIPSGNRVARWLAALCMVVSSAGCILTKDLPDPALDIPEGYKAARLTRADAPPTLDWWRGFRSPELTTLMEEAQTVNLDIAAATARFIQADAQARVAGARAAAEPQRHGSAELCPHLGFNLQRIEHWRTRDHPLPGLAQRQLRVRFLGQEPRRRAGGGGDRHRHPLRSRRGGAHRAGQRRQRLFPGAGVAGPDSNRRTQHRQRAAHPRRHQAAAERRHRNRPRRRAAGSRAGQSARRGADAAPDAGAERQCAGHAGGAAAGKRARHRRLAQPDFVAAGDAGPAVGIADAASGYQAPGSAARRRHRQCRQRPRAVLSLASS